MFNTNQIVLLVLVFWCVVYGAWLLLGRLTPDTWLQRIEAIRGDAPVRVDGLARLKQFAHALGKLSGEKEDVGVRQKLLHAGYRDPSAFAVYMGARILLAGILLALAWLFMPQGLSATGRPLWLGLSAVLGCYLPQLALSRQVKQRQQQLAYGLPDALDMMTIAVDGGLGLDVAMQRVTSKVGIQTAVLRQEFDATWLEIQVGVPRAAALRNLARRTGVEDINLLVALLNSADQLGVSVGGALHNFSAALRLKRQQRAEESAATVPVKLMFPLMFLILPVLMMLLLAPSVARIADALGAASGGGGI
jgi:tight adherence protein C